MRARRPSVVGRDFRVHIAVSMWTVCGRPIKTVRVQESTDPVTDETCLTCRRIREQDTRRKQAISKS